MFSLGLPNSLQCQTDSSDYNAGGRTVLWLMANDELSVVCGAVRTIPY